MSTPPDTYTHGHHASVVAQHARRSAEVDAAFVLPHLKPGMRLLDFGCGPGTITVGLAQRVAPGETIGIDLSEAVLEEARANTAHAGLPTLRFEVADVYALPYPDSAFDAVFGNQVLQHLTRPVDALREIRRVLAPSGFAAPRDVDYATMVAYPRSPAIDRWLELYHEVTRRNHAEADAGRHMAHWLKEAGYTDITLYGDVTHYVGQSAIDWGTAWSQRILESSFAHQAVDYGLATRAGLEQLSAGWKAWAAHPDAFFMFAHIAAIAR